MCQDALVAYGDADLQGDMSAIDLDPKRFRPSRSQWQRPFEVLASGQIRLGACTSDAGTAVPCYAAKAAALP